MPRCRRADGAGDGARLASLEKACGLSRTPACSLILAAGSAACKARPREQCLARPGSSAGFRPGKQASVRLGKPPAMARGAPACGHWRSARPPARPSSVRGSRLQTAIRSATRELPERSAQPASRRVHPGGSQRGASAGLSGTEGALLHEPAVRRGALAEPVAHGGSHAAGFIPAAFRQRGGTRRKSHYFRYGAGSRRLGRVATAPRRGRRRRPGRRVTATGRQRRPPPAPSRREANAAGRLPTRRALRRSDLRRRQCCVHGAAPASSALRAPAHPLASCRHARYDRAHVRPAARVPHSGVEPCPRRCCWPSLTCRHCCGPC
jgi:hypothetical protein